MKQREWTEADWDTLVASIKDGEVIPIVGEKLSLIEENGTIRSFQDCFSNKIASNLQIESGQSSNISSLADLASEYVSQAATRVDIDDLYDEVYRESKKMFQSCPAAPLKNLADISDIKLFVTLGIDSLLQKALEIARPMQKIEPCIYNPKKPDDIEWPPKQTILYHLFGRINALRGEYVLTGEDLLEFMHSLQSNDKRPRELFLQLSNKRLLILGSSFPEWLTLFFLRMSSDDRLSKRLNQIILVDDELEQHTELQRFISLFSKKVRLVPQSAESFVHELHSRWMVTTESTVATESAKADVFISYKGGENGDLKYAESIRNTILSRCPTLNVWLDKAGGLRESGDPYLKKMYQQIKQAKVFIPVVSEKSLNATGHVRTEWIYAEGRAADLGDNVPFIRPIWVDSKPNYRDERLPETFKGLTHAEMLQYGEVTAGFVQDVIDAVRFHVKNGIV